jgi:hypothetical protein
MFSVFVSMRSAALVLAAVVVALAGHLQPSSAFQSLMETMNLLQMDSSFDQRD